MRRLFLAFALLSISQSAAGAQTTEVPVPFDTAGRILSVSPPLATRLGLAAPAWPVAGAFGEARLFRVGGGGFVLTATRPDGSTDRYQLTNAEADALRATFAEAMVRAGRVVAEDAALTISEPARAPFVRDQMILASVLYGPAVANLTSSGSAGAGAYLLTVGTTFFVINDFARKRSITRAQNAMATDGAIRGWAATALAADALGANLSGDGAAITALIGGIGGSMTGYHRGRSLTHSEAEAAMTMSTLVGATVLGATASTGMIDDDDSSLASGVLLLGGIAGYVAGPEYPRRASYTVTAGDIGLVRLGALLGAAAALTPIVDSDISVEAAAAVTTAGLIGGAVIADRIAVRPFDHGTGDTRMIYLGALGGGLMGLALPVLTESDNGPFVLGAMTAGAIAGSFGAAAMQRGRDGGLRSADRSSNGRRKLEFNAAGLALAAAGRPGNHTIVKIRFR